MKTSLLAGAGAAAVGVATAVTALLLGSTVAVADVPRPEAAYGLAAAGLLPIDPIPYVASPDGMLVEDELIGLVRDDLVVDVLTVEARRGFAQSTAVEINALGLLSADLVRTTCDDGHGSLEILGGSLLGTPLPKIPVPGQTIDLSPLVRVSFANETRNPDGSLTITGIEITVLPAPKDLDEPLGMDDRPALVALSELVGVDLTGSKRTVGELVSALRKELGKHLDLSESLQTITIGSATCDRFGDKLGYADKGYEKDDGKGKLDDGKGKWTKDGGKGGPVPSSPGGNGGDGGPVPSSPGGNGGDGGPVPSSPGGNGGNGGSPDEPAVPEAPAPAIVVSNLPVTG